MDREMPYWGGWIALLLLFLCTIVATLALTMFIASVLEEVIESF